MTNNNTQPSQQVPSELPFLVEFAASYLDGVMEGEHPEIQEKWATIRKYLAQSATAAPAAIDVRDVLEQAARICESVNNYDNPMTAQECADAIRALQSPPQTGNAGEAVKGGEA